MTFDEVLNILQDNEVPYKLSEIITNDNEDVYVFNVYIEKETGDNSE
jgi:hypothetical protein|tara:strand:+ start:15289 stop:15429 length:141 start_codon:yes stop_codon:yes gene_type:complete